MDRRGPAPPRCAAVAAGGHRARSGAAGTTPTSPPSSSRNPRDKALIELVGELSTRSELFRRRWAQHDVKFHRSGQKRLRHPVVGQLDLDFEGLELASSPGPYLNVYPAAAGTPTADALKLLASWAASQDHLPSEAVPTPAG
jgi:hypothetical protein